MSRRLFTLLLLTLVLPLQPVSAGNPIVVCRKVAERIINVSNHKLVTDSLGQPHVDCYYQEWRYVNGVLALAMQTLSDLTGEQSYRRFVADNYAFFFNDSVSSVLRRAFDHGIRDYGWKRFFTMSSLDDCGAMGAGLTMLNRQLTREEYTSYIRQIRNYILRGQRRVILDSIGYRTVYCRGSLGERTVWMDDLYMSTSFLCRQTGDDSCATMAVQQALAFDSLLYDPVAGAYRHCIYYDEGCSQGVACWGRANGWAFMAMADILDNVPSSTPGYGRLLACFRNRCASLCRLQDDEGMWHQLLDRKDSYAETSCTAMFVYALAKGVRRGWLDSAMVTTARKGWDALCTRIDDEGHVNGTCMGTSISKDIHYYYLRPCPVDDAHGLGPVILAGLEMNQLTR